MGGLIEIGGGGVGTKWPLRNNQPFRSLRCARSVSFLGDSLGLVTLQLQARQYLLPPRELRIRETVVGRSVPFRRV